MCGIVGFLAPAAWGRDGDAWQQTVLRMGDRLRHRGPDDAGAWVDPQAGVALGHRRLSIVDLSPAGHQPMVSASGRYVLVFNGEVYNHRALREQLSAVQRPDGGAAAAAWRGHSDTETLLAGFEAWGVQATLERAVGMFAIGLWDRQDGALLLARDRLGEKPLYYGWQGGCLLFASELKALKGHPAFRAQVDRQALAQQLCYGYVPAPRSIYQGIHKLPAGTLLRLPGGAAAAATGLPAPVAYWSFTQVAQAGQAAPLPAGESAALDQLEALLRDAVRLQMVADVPLGAFLSGGVDSSTVVALMQAQSDRRVRTFTIGFEEAAFDEAGDARAVARHLGTEHTELYVTPAAALEVVPQLPAIYDEPFADISQIPTFLLARLARAQVTVSLSGDGGDELFGGNARYAKQRVFGWYDRVPAVLRRGLLEPALERTPIGGLPLARKGRSYVEQAKVPLPDRMQQYNLLLRLGIGEVFTPDFLARIDLADPLRQQQGVWQQVPRGSALNRMLAYDWRYTLAEADLPKVCGTTALAGVDVAFPFLDARVVDFSLRLPTDYKLKGLKLRWFFKEALRGFLPDEIITKKKQGFGLPFGVWATRHDGLNALASDTLESLAGRGVVRRDFIRTLLRDRLPEHPGYYGEMVWILMMLEQWLKRHAGTLALGPG